MHQVDKIRDYILEDKVKSAEALFLADYDRELIKRGWESKSDYFGGAYSKGNQLLFFSDKKAGNDLAAESLDSAFIIEYPNPARAIKYYNRLEDVMPLYGVIIGMLGTVGASLAAEITNGIKHDFHNVSYTRIISLTLLRQQTASDQILADLGIIAGVCVLGGIAGGLTHYAIKKKRSQRARAFFDSLEKKAVGTKQVLETILK